MPGGDGGFDSRGDGLTSGRTVRAVMKEFKTLNGGDSFLRIGVGGGIWTKLAVALSKMPSSGTDPVNAIDKDGKAHFISDTELVQEVKRSAPPDLTK